MAKPKFKKSLYFTDHNGQFHFLVQVLNLGRDMNDELKFVFTHAPSGGSGIYTESKG